MLKLLKEAEEKFNCKFTFDIVSAEGITREGFESAMLAGVYYTDAVRFTRHRVLPVYEKNGMILSLNDYFDFNQPVFKQYDQIEGILYPERIYAFFILTILTPRVIFYNKGILNREGLPDLHDLHNQGMWN